MLPAMSPTLKNSRAIGNSDNLVVSGITLTEVARVDEDGVVH
jgi:hypothetical protein